MSFQFKGASADQTSRFGKADEKLLSRMAKDGLFSKVLDTKVSTAGVNMTAINKWVCDRLTLILGFEDDIVSSMITNLLQVPALEGRKLQLGVTGFLEKQAPQFCEDLWLLLIDAMSQPDGIPMALKISNISGFSVAPKQLVIPVIPSAAVPAYTTLAQPVPASSSAESHAESSGRDRDRDRDRKKDRDRDRERNRSRSKERRRRDSRDSRGRRRDSRDRRDRSRDRNRRDSRDRDRDRIRERERVRGKENTRKKVKDERSEDEDEEELSPAVAAQQLEKEKALKALIMEKMSRKKADSEE